MAKKKKAYPSAGRTIDSAKRYKKDFFWGPFFKMFEAIFELITPVMMSLIVSKNGDICIIIWMVYLMKVKTLLLPI